jgi:hypothetical protein
MPLPDSQSGAFGQTQPRLQVWQHHIPIPAGSPVFAAMRRGELASARS